MDYLKFDQCYMPWSRYRGQTREHVDRILYTRMSHDLRATGRAIVFWMCNGWDREAQPWWWGAAVSNLWRTTHDIKDTFASTVNNFTGTVRFWRDARAGAFNDPDMLEIGNGGQTSTEYRAQFSLWAEMAAPLIAGTNLTTLSHADLAIYDNRRVIAVDQDRLARQGRPILHRGGTWALTKPLAGGAHAVVLFNATATPRVISVSARAAGAAPARSYALENLWTGAMTRTAGEIAAFVPAHGAVMDRVTSAPAASVAAPASVLSLQASPATLAPGASLRVRLPLTDESRTALGPSTLTVTAPAGFSPRRVTLRVPEVRHDVTAYGTIVLHAPSHPSAALRLGEIRAVDRRAGDDAALPVRMLSPLPSPWQENDLSGQPATVGGLGTDFSVTSAGTGVSIATSGPTAPTGAVHLLPADDSYTAVADPAVAGQRATAEVTVAAQGGSPLSPFGQAGLVMRDRLAAGTPEGAVLTVDTAGTVSLSWAGRGTSVVTHSASAAATVHLPVRLRLTRRGAHYTGAWSTDGGRTWQTLATAQVTGAGGRGDQAVGILHSSGAAGWWTTAQFTGLSITR